MSRYYVADDNSHSQVLTLCSLPTASGRVAWAVSLCPQLPLGRSPPGVTAAGSRRSKRFARRWWRQSNLAAHRRFHRGYWVAKRSIRLGTQTILVWNGLSSGSRVFLGKGFGGAPDREVRGDARGFDQATGSWVRRSARRLSRGRTALDAGLAAATSTVRRDRRRVGRGVWLVGVGVTCRGGLARPTANLVFAGLHLACQQSAGRCPTLYSLRLGMESPQRMFRGVLRRGPARHRGCGHRWPEPRTAIPGLSLRSCQESGVSGPFAVEQGRRRLLGQSCSCSTMPSRTTTSAGRIPPHFYSPLQRFRATAGRSRTRHGVTLP